MPKFLKGCLTIIAVMLLLIVSCSIYYQHPRFKSSSPVQIDVLSRYRIGTSNIEYRASISNQLACRSLLEALKKARWTGPHRCKSRGTLTIRYQNGEKEIIGFMPGHVSGYYEFRVGGHYRLPKPEFYQAMKEAGIDAEQIPE
jgi:hypothetical protein